MLAAGNGFNLIAEQLIKFGANVNHIDKQGETALIVCAAHGCFDEVKILVENGANINFQDN
jgi:ankyrin repeat protein